MSNLVKKAIRMSIIGFVIGLAVGIMIWLAGGFDYLPEEGRTAKLVLYMIVSGLMGTVGMGLTVVYDIESWSILRATATHFVVTILTFFAMGYIEQWFTLGNIRDVIITIIMFVVAYAIIWLVMYLKYNRQVRKMNEDLRAIRKEKQKKEGNENVQ